MSGRVKGQDDTVSAPRIEMATRSTVGLCGEQRDLNIKWTRKSPVASAVIITTVVTRIMGPSDVDIELLATWHLNGAVHLGLCNLPLPHSRFPLAT
jgi:hypothetical protein